MKAGRWVVLGGLASMAVAVISCQVIPMATESSGRTWTFGEDKPGSAPDGWKVEATGQRGPLPTWQVVEDKSAPSGKRVLAMSSPNHTHRGTYNLCWTKAVAFLDGEIEVRLKSVTGKVDQGGGIIWRAQDKDNYYITRFNPLESNFRVYHVRHGKRSQLDSAKVTLPAGQWDAIRVVHRGSRIVAYLNGKRLLEITDTTFAKAGGVGLWTEADAVTCFDDFTVRAERQ